MYSGRMVGYSHNIISYFKNCFDNIELSSFNRSLGHSSVSVTEKFYAQAGGKDAQMKVEGLANVIPMHRYRAS